MPLGNCISFHIAVGYPAHTWTHTVWVFLVLHIFFRTACCDSPFRHFGTMYLLINGKEFRVGTQDQVTIPYGVRQRAGNLEASKATINLAFWKRFEVNPPIEPPRKFQRLASEARNHLVTLYLYWEDSLKYRVLKLKAGRLGMIQESAVLDMNPTQEPFVEVFLEKTEGHLLDFRLEPLIQVFGVEHEGKIFLLNDYLTDALVYACETRKKYRDLDGVLVEITEGVVTEGDPDSNNEDSWVLRVQGDELQPWQEALQKVFYLAQKGELDWP